MNGSDNAKHRGGRPPEPGRGRPAPAADARGREAARPARTDQVVLRSDSADVAGIMAAIRARVARRRLTLDGGPTRERIHDGLVNIVQAAALSVSVPAAELQALVENTPGWNIDEAFSIQSHRKGLGRLIVAAKRALRAVLGVLARPLVHHQAEINRRQSILTRQALLELSRQNMELRAALMKIGALARKAGQDPELSDPIVLFADEATRSQAAPPREPGFRHARRRPRGPQTQRPPGPPSSGGPK